jgi:hypothetical protein
MKTKIKTSLIILLGLVFFTGCKEDFLDVPPPSSLTGETFFRNQADAEAVVAAAYKPLINTGNYAKAMEAPLDDIVIFNTQGLNLDSWSIDANEAITDDLWQNGYEGVFRANIVLQEVPKITSIPQAVRDRMVGEARFLRALYYFQLTNNFGEIPLVTTADPADPSKAAIAKSPVTDVYKLIVDDLTQAMTLLPGSYAAADVGRATKWAAQALLGKVYLFSKNYPLAETNLKAVIDGGPFTLLPNFSDLLIKDNNAESIFEIQFADISGQGTSRITNDYPQGQGGFANLLPTQSLVNEFETYAGPTAINGRDPRLFYSIFRQGDPYDAVSPTFQATWTPTGYSRKKGMFPVIRTNNGNLGLNFPIIRLADVLLMYAEAANENNKPLLALDAINKVRDRPSVKMPPVVAVTKAQIFAAIVHERRVELAFEYHRLDDLRRWGLAQQYLGPLGYTSPKNQYFPIPQQELQTNPKLVQNPGY